MKVQFGTPKVKKAKWLLVATAILIAVFSLVFSHKLTSNLREDEMTKMKVWAEAMRSLNAPDSQTDLSLALEVIRSNQSIPVIVADRMDNVTQWRNLSSEPSGEDSVAMLKESLQQMKADGKSLRINLVEGGEDTINCDYIVVYYEESVMLRRLRIYPYVQLSVVAFFMGMAIWTLLTSKKAEQNRVWVGLSRETAHQLGTPISSLMAWSQVLGETYPDDPLFKEMDKDIKRLQLVAERFSKIGSAPELKEEDVNELIKRVVEYFDHRTSRKVNFELILPPMPMVYNINAPLFEWVIENLCKNAIDAMEGEGFISISVERLGTSAHIEVRDTGKGIHRKNFKTVFNPGFTTKKRGWGLGLSLAKRIINEYHHGKIYVKDSEPGIGTIFAIDLV